jgi:hypothetical protein
MRRSLLLLSALFGFASGVMAQAPALTPFGASGGAPAAPWHVVGLPQQTKPFTQFSVVDLDGKRALKVESQEAYGNLVHPLNWTTTSAKLAWQWRIEQPIEASDLQTKGGDDTALKVCVSFDLSIDKIPFGDRQLLRFARSKTTEPVPAATVCYVWDAKLAAGTALDNAFTKRIRYMVVRSGPQKLNQWTSERRDVTADFIKLFGNESDTVPPIIGVAIGADSDNTKSHSVGYVTGVALEP